MWKQVKKFDINKMGNRLGYCLMNVRLGFDIPGKYVDAKADMEANKRNGTLHPIETLPKNVAVPVYVDTSNIHEHIIVSDKGVFYSDKRRLTSTNNLKFFGWGECVNDVRVVKWEKDPEGSDEPVRRYQNGSTVEKVYADTNCTKEIGSLNPGESCDCFGEFNGRAIVRYRVDRTNNYKIGFCKWLGGIK